MKTWKAICADESGESTIEFIGVSLVLLIPLVYLVLVVSAIQRATFATEAGVQEAARIISLYPDEAGEAHARLGVYTAIGDQGFPPDPEAFEIICESGACPAAGSTARLRTKVDVNLPLLPAFLDSVLPSIVTITSERTVTWGEYAG